MDEQVLKGNFKVKKEVTLKEDKKEVSVREQLRERALASLGGSMVYMERTDLTWEGDE